MRKTPDPASHPPTSAAPPTRRNLGAWEEAVGDRSRLVALSDALLMDTGAEEAFDRLTRIASHLLGVPVALLSLIDDRRQFFKSAAVPPNAASFPKETPLTQSLCRHVVAERAPLVVNDLTTDPDFRDHPAIAALDVQAYAGVPVLDASGFAIGALCAIDHAPRAFSAQDLVVLSDLAAAAMTELALRAKVREHAESEAKFRAVVTNLPNGAVLMFDRDLRYTVADGAEFTTVVGIPRARIVGHTVAEVSAPENRAKLVEACKATLAGTSSDLELQRDGMMFLLHFVPVRNDVGVVTSGMMLAYNVTDLKRAEALASVAAQRDELTGLLNRRGFMERGREALAVATAAGAPGALFFVDLNGMKRINDELGHGQGDAALIETARTLSQVFGAHALVARLGGDEFVVFVRVAAADAGGLRDRVRASVRALNATGAHAFRLSLSVGTTLFNPDKPDTIEALLAKADALMYAEKRARARAGASIMPPGAGE